MEEHAPQGYAAIVECFLHGDPSPVFVSVVESKRDDPTILLHEYAEGADDPERAYPGDRLVFTERGNVGRVVVRFIEVGQPPKRRIGFRLDEAQGED